MKRVWLGLAFCFVLAACEPSQRTQDAEPIPPTATELPPAPIESDLELQTYDPQILAILTELQSRGAISGQITLASVPIDAPAFAPTDALDLLSDRSTQDLAEELRGLIHAQSLNFRWHDEEDTRTDLTELPELIEHIRTERVLSNADAVFALIPKNAFSRGDPLRLQSPSYRSRHNVCPTESFLAQPAAAACSSFLITPTRLVTAAHCVAANGQVSDAVAQSFYAVRNFQVTGQTQRPSLDHAQLHTIRRVLVHKLNEAEDWAVLELTESIEDPTLLDPRGNGRVPLDTPVHTLGFPSGLPLKFAYGGKVTQLPSGQPWFLATLDVFKSNSGSPVINDQTFAVEGIVTDVLDDDWIYDRERDCHIPFGCPISPNGCLTNGERVMHIDRVVMELARFDSTPS